MKCNPSKTSNEARSVLGPPGKRGVQGSNERRAVGQAPVCLCVSVFACEGLRRTGPENGQGRKKKDGGAVGPLIVGVVSVFFFLHARARKLGSPYLGIRMRGETGSSPASRPVWARSGERPDRCRRRCPPQTLSYPRSCCPTEGGDTARLGTASWAPLSSRRGSWTVAETRGGLISRRSRSVLPAYFSTGRFRQIPPPRPLCARFYERLCPRI